MQNAKQQRFCIVTAENIQFLAVTAESLLNLMHRASTADCD